jgi:hypothetical protein
MPFTTAQSESLQMNKPVMDQEVLSKKLEPTLLQPDNHNKKYESLFNEIDTGQIKLPMFQREFVWDKEQSAKLIDSILKGYPIGTFIFWKTKDELRSYRNLGNHKLPNTPKGDYVQYVLDGQQRITSLYAIRKGIRLSKEGREIDYKDIFIDLDYDPSSDDQIVVTERVDGRRYESVHGLLSRPLGEFYKTLPHLLADKLEHYKTKLTSYDFSSITIKDYPIEIACEVFTRINTGGKPLSLFEILVAKTYDETQSFDLAEKYDLLVGGNDEEKECLSEAKFETISEAVVTQCVAAIILKAVRSRDILKISRPTFIANWEPMKKSLFMAVDFVRTELRIPVSQLLPYPAILVPLTYFFHQSVNKKPDLTRVSFLEQFFYWAGITYRYSSATESKIAEDLLRVDQIVEGKQPTYPLTELEVSAETIRETDFRAGNAFCKTILCLLAYQMPKSFDTNGIVILDNSNLKIATSRNYHHFFPKKYLEEREPGSIPNLIANITLIDGYSNKHKIGKKSPKSYIGAFAKHNKKIGQTLRSHLIGDLETFGVDTNNYELFVERRSAAIASALNAKLSRGSLPGSAENE